MQTLIFLASATPASARVSHPIPENIATVPISRLQENWWRSRFAEKQLEMRQQPVELLWLGDSITQNWETAGPEPWRAFAPIWQRYYGDRKAINFGFKGDSTCHLLWRLQHGELDGISPRGIVLLIGANNFGHLHTDAIETFAGIEAVLDEIHRRLPRTRVVLLAVLPSIRSSWVSRNTASLNLRLSQSVRIGRSYLTFVDTTSLLEKDGAADPSRFLDARLKPPAPSLHPTAQSQERIAEAIEPAVAAMLGDYVHR